MRVFKGEGVPMLVDFIGASSESFHELTAGRTLLHTI